LYLAGRPISSGTPLHLNALGFEDAREDEETMME
jgi:hypothetical protein